MDDVMEYRKLGKSDCSVSSVGFGAWGIGGAMWRGVEDDESLAAVRAALDHGINFFDTALAYGDGHSERLLGGIRQATGAKMLIATKIPPKNYVWPARLGSSFKEVFPGEYIISSTEQSLRNLGLDCVEVQQLHVWQDAWAGVDEIWNAVAALKRDGKIRAFGISINDHEPENVIAALGTGMVDTVQVIYNIFDQSPEDRLLEYCREHGIGVIVRVPFDEGSLTGAITPATVFPEHDWRKNYFRGNRKAEVHARVQKLELLLGREVSSLAELSLRFILSHPAVSTVIPGMRRVKNVAANAAAGDGRALSRKLLGELKSHRWVRNYYERE